ncbi:MAG: hypothetical protein A2Y14_04010 [Verrucomicrobia bacterium GWF2_51_19]|nr:MAG: hypothetical protein A2Y14_04010 [Verrucomicrobia bacterium GWF2_51_19]HCJ11674.1 hypothetical protein [Opitutae bacterium]
MITVNILKVLGKNHWALVSPEWSFLIFGMLFVLLKILNRRIGFNLVWAFCVAIGLALLFRQLFGPQKFVLFGDSIHGSHKTAAFELVLYTSMLLSLPSLKTVAANVQEEVRALWFFFWGSLFFLVMSVSLLNIFLFAEAASLLLLCMAWIGRNRDTLWRALIYNAVSDLLLLAGMGLLFYLSTNQNLPNAISENPFLFDTLAGFFSTNNEPWMLVALGLTLCGLFAKLGMFPMHFASADIYEGSHLSTIALTMSFKVALVCVLWHGMHGGLAVFVAVGVVVAAVASITEPHTKRFLAHSDSLQLGLLLLCGDLKSFIAGMLAYVVAMQCLLGVLSHLNADDAFPFNNLYKRSIGLTWAWIIPLVLFAGIPPFPGFFQKGQLLKPLLFEGQAVVFWTLLFALWVGSYGYIKRIRDSFYDFRGAPDEPSIVLTRFWKITFICLASAIVFLPVI